MNRVWLLLFFVLVGCASPPGNSVTYELPDRQLFLQANVSGFLEARCGALDCHGAIGRPLRIYSQNGLRLNAADGGGRDRGPTTDVERIENYRAVIGLEPDELSKAVAADGDYFDYQLVQKPIDIQGGGVRHKGGPVLSPSQSDPGWVCLTGWIAGSKDIAQACLDAANATR